MAQNLHGSDVSSIAHCRRCMTECREFFQRLDAECESKQDGSIRGDRLRAERRERLIEWESQTASQHSPGPIESGEKIRKALFQGQDIVEGSLYRGTFSSLVTIGFSADRINHTTADDSKNRFARMASATRALYGYIDVDVADLRARRYKEDEKNPDAESVRAIAVYDTALEDNVAHAEAFMIAKFSNKRPYKSIQADLMDKYQTEIVAF